MVEAGDSPTNEGTVVVPGKIVQDSQAGSPQHVNVGSEGDFAKTPMTTLRQRHSEVFVKEDKPTSRWSFLADHRYHIDDTNIVGGEPNEVELSPLPSITPNGSAQLS